MMRKAIKHFCSDRAGSAAMAFVFAIPGVLGITGAAVDYATVSSQKSGLQTIADSAALAIGRQMTLMKMSDAQIESAAKFFVEGNQAGSPFKSISVQAKPGPDRLTLKVRVAATGKSSFGFMEMAIGKIALEASATAQVGQATKLCLFSIAQAASNEMASGLYISSEKTGIALMDNSRLTAPDCLLHTNVPAKTAITIASGSAIKAGVICAVGGVINNAGMIDAAIVDSCPTLKNPMEGRFYPQLGQNCSSPSSYKDITITSGTRTLSPGNYCGNIIISGDAKVTLNPGNYAIQGQLIVKGSAELRGNGVGIYLWGGVSSVTAKNHTASFAFLENALIDLSGPETGPMAGILIWEGINGAATEARANLNGGNFHQINTMRAKKLTGTIYLPGGRLLIDAPGKVADDSDYTVMVVNRLDLKAGPNLVLNADYAKSKVPVPQGLGPIGAKDVRLVR